MSDAVSSSRCLISQLHPFVTGNFNVLGIVIHISDVYTFMAKGNQNMDSSRSLVVTEDNRLMPASEEVSERAVFSFVLTDQAMSSIEFKFWGEKSDAEQMREMVRIGQVIKIIRPKVMAKNAAATSEYSPTTFSSNQLLFSDHLKTVVSVAPSELKESLTPLMRLAPTLDFFTLYDVTMSEHNLNDCQLSLLATVAQISPPKVILSQRLQRNLTRFKM